MRLSKRQYNGPLVGRGKMPKSFEQQLKACVRGEVYFDELSLGLYATDASIYQIKPIAVVVPKDEADVVAAVETAGKYKVSILPRGAGTSLGGQAVGESMVIDFSKYMNRILELNVKKRWVRVQPGLVLDELNAALSAHNLHFAPDPATSDRATIGGMIGNNASGTRSIIYGITSDHVLEAKALLAGAGRGEIVEFKELCPTEFERACGQQGREGKILSDFKRIIEANQQEIKKRFPKVVRKVSGYNLDSFVNTPSGGGWNLSKLMVGSEGTLATVLEAKLNLEPLPAAKCLCVVHFAELLDALKAVKSILVQRPSAVEILDRQIIEQARQSPATAGLCGFLKGEPAAVLVVEFFGRSTEAAEQKAQELAGQLQNQAVGFAWPVLSELEQQAAVWAVRKNGLGLMGKAGGQARPIAFIEDACVPVEALPEYVEKVLAFCKSLNPAGRVQGPDKTCGVPVAMYGHAGAGTIHLRPLLNLKKQEDIERMKAIAEYAFELVVKYGGSWSAEHGDGRIRSGWVESFFGPAIYEAFKQVKRLFDSAGLMNPGVIIDALPVEQNLRYGPEYPGLLKQAVGGEYHYRPCEQETGAVAAVGSESGFAALVEICSGVGTCRQTASGVMCPSYRATRDEKHSTRGRANALRLAMTGQLGPKAMTGKALFEVLGLCLSCKACKSECPNNVDLAKLKSEFLQKYHDAHWVGLRERIIAASALMAKLFAGRSTPIVNFVQGTRLFRKILEMVAGFDSRRKPPEYARVPLSKWFAQRPRPNGQPAKKVVLFDDTYMSYYETNVGISAVELLESCGYEVVLARAGCCQRPRISHGFLRQAKRHGEKTLRKLDAYIQQGLKVVVAEPACASALTDDLPDLIDDKQLSRRIKENVMMIDVFLARRLEEGKLDCEFTSDFNKILIHGNCHQKSLYGTAAMKQILQRVAGISVKEIDSGCCGMAGSFGYEKEHYELSMQIGEDRLFPAIRSRQEGTVVVACGFSCRHQIADVTGVKPLHWVETIRAKPRPHNNPAGPGALGGAVNKT